MATDSPSTASSTFTVGVDLAAQPKNTAVCKIEWTGGHGRIIDTESGWSSDAGLLQLLRDESTTKLAIDAPLGWPAEFVKAIAEYSADGIWPNLATEHLEFRETDRRVRDEVKRRPLSVCASLLAIPTMRCARLLSAFHSGENIDRSGEGRIVEVYPAAALRRWGFNPLGYKRDKAPAPDLRRELVAGIRRETEGWLDTNPDFWETCERSDHVVDALVAALTARAVERDGHADPVSAEDRQMARVEGWIRLPCQPLRLLGAGSP